LFFVGGFQLDAAVRNFRDGVARDAFRDRQRFFQIGIVSTGLIVQGAAEARA